MSKAPPDSATVVHTSNTTSTTPPDLHTAPPPGAADATPTPPRTCLTLECPKSPWATRCQASYRAALLAYTRFFPFFGILLALFAYDDCIHGNPGYAWQPRIQWLQQTSHDCAVYSLLLIPIAFCAWALGSLILCALSGVTQSRYANTTAYTIAFNTLNEVFVKLRDFCEGAGLARPIEAQDNQNSLPTLVSRGERSSFMAYNAGCRLYNEALAQLKSGGRQWLDGTGYVAVSVSVHRVEEALFEFEDQAAVLGDALYDYQRISGSTIDSATKQSLLTKIRLAVYSLSTETYTLYWPDIPPPESKLDLGSARAMLRVVRRTMNELRDGIRAQLGQIRSRAVATSTLLGWSLVLLTVAGIAGAWHADPLQLKDYSRTIFVFGPLIVFFVGAGAGLLYRLYSDSRAGLANDVKVSEDGDLTEVPVEFAPLVSGLSAIGGVIVTGGLFAAAIAGPNAATLAAAGAPASAAMNRLFAASELTSLALMAAAFGVAPGLLFDRLAQYTGTLKKDLQSSSAAPATGRASYDAAALRKVARAAPREP